MNEQLSLQNWHLFQGRTSNSRRREELRGINVASVQRVPKIAIAASLSKHLQHLHVGRKRLVIDVYQGVVRGMRHIHAHGVPGRVSLFVVVFVTIAMWSRR